MQAPRDLMPARLGGGGEERGGERDRGSEGDGGGGGEGGLHRRPGSPPVRNAPGGGRQLGAPREHCSRSRPLLHHGPAPGRQLGTTDPDEFRTIRWADTGRPPSTNGLRLSG
jgi:hypothetical protein